MTPQIDPSRVRLALPKGRMQEGVTALLSEAGIQLRASARQYRPTLSMDGFEVKLLKPQNIIEMLHAGSRDLGFAGADWAAELSADLVELLDTGLDPVRIVAAAPAPLADMGALRERRDLVVASEYSELTKRWIARNELDATFLRTFGATEVFPPEDADLVIDNSATGSTLLANGLDVADEVMTSSTRLYASPQALEDRERRTRIEDFTLLVRSVLEARRRVLIEINVTPERLDALCELLPCMDRPTVSALAGDGGYAVKAAVPRDEVPRLVPKVKSCGGTDIVVSPVSQVVR